MPRITDSKFLVNAKPCIVCGGQRDRSYAYTTGQGKRSVRTDPRCSGCEKARRAARYVRTGDSGQAWKAQNRERILAYNRERQTDPEFKALKAYHQRLRKARIRSGQPDDPAVRAIYRQAKEEEALIQSCPIFALPELGYELQVDHVWPLARGGAHVASNLQILPIGLNMRKGAKCPS